MFKLLIIAAAVGGIFWKFPEAREAAEPLARQGAALASDAVQAGWPRIKEAASPLTAKLTDLVREQLHSAVDSVGN